MSGVFVTGTDTGVGKTFVATALLRAYALAGRRAVGMKPVAAGATRTAEGWDNEDVRELMAASNVRAPLGEVNPYCFEPPIAPHVAAARAGVPIAFEHIARCYEALAGRADVVVVEGAGGFLVPLDEHRTFADLAVRLGLPVVLVVGMRLGCLNHALLTRDAVVSRGLALAGWVANRIDPAMAACDENVEALRRRMGAPLLGDLPRNLPPEECAMRLATPVS